jgi:hypothetical protein
VAARPGEGQHGSSIDLAFFNAPAVDEIDLSTYTGKPGEVIKISASDDFEVVGVSVTIRATDGTVLEEGAPAKSAADGAFTYTTTTNVAQGQPISLEVTATDRPGNRTTKVQSRG